MSSKNKTKTLTSICDRLSKKFRVRPFPEELASVEALLISILVEKAPQPRAEQAVKRFETVFVDWNETRVTSGREIAEAAKDKLIDQRLARACRDALNKLYADRASFDMSFLAEESFAGMRSYLLNTLGLAPRPAAWLMLLLFDRPALPMTEEVRRVANRIGLAEPSWSHDRAQRSLERLIPSARVAEFFHYTTQHAEATCLAPTPRCSRCLLRTICDYYADPVKSKEKEEKAAKKAERKMKKKVAKKTATKKKAKTVTKKKTIKKKSTNKKKK